VSAERNPILADCPSGLEVFPDGLPPHPASPAAIAAAIPAAIHIFQNFFIFSNPFFLADNEFPAVSAKKGAPVYGIYSPYTGAPLRGTTL
jgi:hypothetical protein